MAWKILDFWECSVQKLMTIISVVAWKAEPVFVVDKLSSTQHFNNIFCMSVQ